MIKLPDDWSSKCQVFLQSRECDSAFLVLLRLPGTPAWLEILNPMSQARMEYDWKQTCFNYERAVDRPLPKLQLRVRVSGWSDEKLAKHINTKYKGWFVWKCDLAGVEVDEAESIVGCGEGER